MSSNHLIPFSSCPQSFPASGSFPVSWLFKSVGQYWSFSFNISPSNEYSGLISFRIDWFDLLALQRTLKSLLQHHSLKTSILWCSAFFMVQLSHLYMTTGKAIALTIWTFVGKVMSLLFNTLSRFGFLGGSDSKVSACNEGDLGLIPGLGRFPWRRQRLPTLFFWPGEFHGLYNSWGCKELDMTE